MKKIFLLIIFFSFFFPISVCRSLEYSKDVQVEILEQLEESDAKYLKNYLPDYSLELMNQASISDIFSVKNLNFESVLNIILNLVNKKIMLPIKFALPIVSVIIIYSFFSSFCSAEQEILKFIIVCFVCISTSYNLTNSVQNVALCLNMASKFILCFVPVFSMFSISLGAPLSAMAFNSSIMFFNQVMLSIAKDTIFPIFSTMSGLCIISSLSTKIKMNKIFDIFYSTIKWILVFLTVLVSFIFSVQKIIGSSIENAVGKEIKFMSGLVPIVGSALSDATSVVRSAARILWVNVGSFGMISILFIFLPAIVDCLIWNISFQICEFLSQIFGFENLEKLFLSFKKIINVILAIEIIFICIFIFVTAVAMTVNV